MSEMGMQLSKDKLTITQLDDSLQKLIGTVNRFQAAVSTRLLKPMDDAIDRFKQSAQSMGTMSYTIEEVSKNIGKAYQNMFSGAKVKVKDDGTQQIQRTVDKFRQLFNQLVDISKADVNSDFSKMAKGFSNLGAGLRDIGALNDSDIQRAKSSVTQLSQLVHSIQLVQNAKDKAALGQGVTGFVQSQVRAIGQVGDALQKFGAALHSFITSDNSGSFLEDSKRLQVVKKNVSSLFKAFAKLYQGVVVQAKTAHGDGSVTTVQQIQEAVDSTTRGFSRVAQLLPRLAQGVHQYSKYSTSDTDKALSNIKTFQTKVTNLFNAMGKLYKSLVQQVTYRDSNGQQFVQQKMKQSFDSKTKAMSRVITLLNKFCSTMVQFTVFNDKDIAQITGNFNKLKDSILKMFEAMGSLYKSMHQTTTFRDSNGQEFTQTVQVEDFSSKTKAMSRVLSLISTMTKDIQGVLGLDINKFGVVLGTVQKNILDFMNNMAKLTNLPSFAKFERLASAMQKVSTASKNLITSTEKTKTALKKLKKSPNKSVFSFNKLHPAVRQFFTAFAGYNVIYSIARAIQASVKQMTKLQIAMAKVNTIARVSSVVLKQWTGDIVSLSTKYGVNLQDSANALYQINSATIVGSNSFKVLQASMKMAVAGFTDVSKTASLLSRIINAYGYSADDAGKLSDILFRTVQRGINPMEELSQYMGRILTVASNAGVTFEEVSGAIATLTTRGLQTNIAVTSLNSAILKLSQGSDKLNAIFRAQGYVSSASALQLQGLGGAMRILQQATQGNTAALTQLGFNYRDIRAVSVLASDAYSTMVDNMKRMQDSAGATDAALQKVQDTLSWKWDHFKNILQEYILKFQQWANSSEFLKGVLDALTKALEFLGRVFSGTTTGMDQIILLFGKLAVFAYIFPKFSAGWKSVTDACKSFKQQVRQVQVQLDAAKQKQQKLNQERQYREVPTGFYRHSGTPYTKKIPILTQQQTAQRLRMQQAKGQLNKLRQDGSLYTLPQKTVRQAYKQMTQGITPNIQALKKFGSSSQESLLKLEKLNGGVGKSTITFKAWAIGIGRAAKASASFQQIAGALKGALTGLAISAVVSVFQGIRSAGESLKELDKPAEQFKANLDSINQASTNASVQMASFTGSVFDRAKQVNSMNKVIDDLNNNIVSLQTQCANARAQGQIVDGATLVTLQLARNKVQRYKKQIQNFRKQMQNLSPKQRQARKQSIFTEDIQARATTLRDKNVPKQIKYYNALRRKQQLQQMNLGFDLSILQSTPQAFETLAAQATASGYSFDRIRLASEQYLQVLQTLSGTSKDAIKTQKVKKLSLRRQTLSQQLSDLGQSTSLATTKAGYDYQSLVKTQERFLNVFSMDARRALSVGSWGTKQKFNKARNDGHAPIAVFDRFIEQAKLDRKTLEKNKDILERQKIAQSGLVATADITVKQRERWDQRALQGLDKSGDRTSARQQAINTAKMNRDQLYRTESKLNQVTNLLKDEYFVSRQAGANIQAYMKNVTDKTVKDNFEAAKVHANITDFSKATSKQLHVFRQQFRNLTLDSTYNDFRNSTNRRSIANLQAVQASIIKGGMNKGVETFNKVFNMGLLRNVMGDKKAQAARDQIIGFINRNITNFGVKYKSIIEDIDAGMSTDSLVGKYARNLSGSALKQFIENVQKQRKARQDWFAKASQALSTNTASMIELRGVDTKSKRALKYAKQQFTKTKNEKIQTSSGQMSFQDLQKKYYDRNRQLGIDDAETTQQLIDAGIIDKKEVARIASLGLDYSRYGKILHQKENQKQKAKIMIPEAIQAQTAMSIGSSEFIHTLMTQTNKTPEQKALDSIDKNVKKINKGVSKTADITQTVVYA